MNAYLKNSLKLNAIKLNYYTSYQSVPRTYVCMAINNGRFVCSNRIFMKHFYIDINKRFGISLDDIVCNYSE